MSSGKPIFGRTLLHKRFSSNESGEFPEFEKWLEEDGQQDIEHIGFGEKFIDVVFLRTYNREVLFQEELYDELLPEELEDDLFINNEELDDKEEA